MKAPSPLLLDAASIGACALIWGTTWFAITLQFGAVDPIVSIFYRFSLASSLLFAWCLLRKEKIGLTRAQHGAAFGVGVFTFAIDYACVYWAEQHVASAVVAVIFAALAFVNLISFRAAFGERTSAQAWVAALLGIGGVAVLSWSELAHAVLSEPTLAGIGLAFGAVVFASAGNVFARRGDLAGSPVAAATAWAMLYGAGLLGLFALASGRAFVFEPTWTYVASLLHLSVLGSVTAFVLFFSLARRRGYSSASYISALTPPTAMLMSALFEHKHWGLAAYAGVGLVLGGQWLLLRAKRS